MIMLHLFILILTNKQNKLSLIHQVLKSLEILQQIICLLELIVFFLTTEDLSILKLQLNNQINFQTYFKFHFVQVLLTEDLTLLELVQLLMIGQLSADLNLQPLKFKLFKVFSNLKVTTKCKKKTEQKHKSTLQKCIFFRFYIFVSI